ncbi:MAG TPA: hypothetical protein VIH59_26460 [Candidatus Tectomicrobia bacterium]
MVFEGFADALEVGIRIASVGLVLTALELFSDRRAFGQQGPFSPAVFASLGGRPAPFWIARPVSVAIVACLQVVMAVILIVIGPFPLIGRIALVTATATSMTLRWRRTIGGDGAEQLTIIVLIAALAALVPTPREERLAYAAIFVAAQAALAYVTAGLSKLVSPVWRNGTALPAILATAGHGQAWAARTLQDCPKISIGLTWGVIILEILFPVLLLGPRPLAVATLGAGLAFHIGCAVLMGLNSFVWAFPATYPCLLSVRAHLLE